MPIKKQAGAAVSWLVFFAMKENIPVLMLRAVCGDGGST